MSQQLREFRPGIREWFLSKYRPTEIQSKAWPAIAAGQHVLLTAPTGSGKTLAAFLWSINQLANRGNRGLAVLYISPLRALGNDMRQNLREPLAELQAAGAIPDIQVGVRTGDTPQSERLRQLRNPPDILITTPESLNLLLLGQRSRQALSGVQTVILDEVHALFGSKRGVHMIAAIERLTLLAGEFQRIALSATINPVQEVAQFVAGKNRDMALRPVQILQATEKRSYNLSIHYLENRSEGEGYWLDIRPDLLRLIQAAKNTICFVNNRRLSEKIARLLCELEPGIAWAHHGSLSRELRHSVEAALKAGRLRAVIATSSLELGIDIGACEQVILLETPFSVSSAIQRAGRAAHGVGQVGRVILFPSHPQDLLHSLVMASAIEQSLVEPLLPAGPALDVLVQILLGMIATEDWQEDELYDAVQRMSPYYTLSRKQFNLALELLCGRYESLRISELRPRLVRENGRLRALPGVDRILRLSGGTIAERGLYTLRREDTRDKIGELDEEFVWERRIGDAFQFGTQSWKVTAIGDNEIHALPAGAGDIIPFWKAQRRGQSSFFSNMVARALEKIEKSFESFLSENPGSADSAALAFALQKNFADYAAPQALRALEKFLERQLACSGFWPHRYRVLAERCLDQAGRPQIALHTLQGSMVNRPLALLVASIIEKNTGQDVEVEHSDESILFYLPEDLQFAKLLDDLCSCDVLDLLRKRLERTGYFGSHFRENAGRALLILRARYAVRSPLWMLRMRSRKLLEKVLQLKDFPVLLETWRSVLHELELPALQKFLEEIASGKIEVRQVDLEKPSVFSEGAVYQLTNRFMYADDAISSQTISRLDERLYQEIAGKIEFPAEQVLLLERILARTEPGYAPESLDAFISFLEERIFLRPAEWRALLENLSEDLREAAEKSAVSGPMVPSLYFAPASAGLMQSVFHFSSDQASPDHPSLDPILVLGQYLSTRLFVSGSELRAIPLFNALDLQALSDGGQIRDVLRGSELSYILEENYDRLLRRIRQSRRFRSESRPSSDFVLFQASWQGLRLEGSGGKLERILDQLAGYSLPVPLWESAIFPARQPEYRAEDLDALFRRSSIFWFGTAPDKIAFAFLGEEGIFSRLVAQRTETAEAEKALHFAGRKTFLELAGVTGLSFANLAERLWRKVWSGQIRLDSYEGLRLARRKKYSIDGMAITRSRWQRQEPFPGIFETIAWPDPPVDALSRAETMRLCADQLLERYGLLFPALFKQEAWSWSDVFPVLRRMELSGAVLAGNFFSGPGGPQFMLPAAFRHFQKLEKRSFWLSALDPALAIPPEWPAGWPPFRRALHSFLLFHEGRAACYVIRRTHFYLNGNGLPATLLRLFALASNLLEVQKINGSSLENQQNLPIFKEAGFEMDYRRLILRKDRAGRI